MAKNKKTRKPIGLAYSDHHLNIWNNFNQGNRRLTDGLSVMKILKLKAKVLNVPILFTGDLLHKEKQVSNKLLSILLPFFKKIWGSSNYPTFAIDGNHDQCEENTLDHESPSYIKTFSQIYKGLNCVNNESVEYNNLMIHGVPYLTHDLGLNQAIDNRIKKINKKKINILLLHTTLPGAKDTDGRVIDTYVKPTITKQLEKFDIVLVGHIHKPMKLYSNTFQVGAPNHQRKTDKDADLGYCILYDDLSVEYVPLTEFPKFIELEIGAIIPDNKNFYYHKEKQVQTERTTNEDFSDTTNHSKLAKGYLKEKGIKDSKKKKALINILKNND